MDLAAEASSSSYRFVAGAQFAQGAAAVNPEAVVPIGSGASDAGDVTLSGHISYSNIGIPTYINGVLTYPQVDVPTIVRTGTGYIDMVAAGDIKWLDALSPAAVYTAGTVAPNASDFTAPMLPADYIGGVSTNGFVTTPTWATDGGALTLSAGRDIIGVETPVDSELLATNIGVVDAQTLGSNSPSMAQFWSPWYIPLGQTTGQVATPFETSADGVQNSAYVNYGTFFQGVGALGGGNVTVTSGRNTYDLSISLPETIQVSGGRFAGDSAPAAHYYGGGDLSVTVGNNLYSSDFYVGRGTGTVRVIGSVLTDTANPITGQSVGAYDIGFDVNGLPVAATTSAFFTPAPLLLAEQDGYITVQTGGSLTLGGVFQPTRMPLGLYPYYPLTDLPAGSGSGFDSFGANSGVSVMAAGGDLALLDALPPSISSSTFISLQTKSPDNILPPSLEAISVAGDLTIGNNQAFNTAYRLYPSADGNLVLAAGQTLTTAFTSSSGGALTLNVDSIGMTDATTFGDVSLYNILGTPTPTTLAEPLHADDPDPALILAGDDIIGNFKLIKPGMMEAGRDILDTSFTGQNNSVDDVTSIIAGRDIRSTNVIDGTTYPLNGFAVANASQTPAGVSLFELYGPGQFEVAAGRNLGPFLVHPYSDINGGILAVGDGANIGTIKNAQGVTTSGIVPYLPVEGANITTLFGVGNGVDYSAAVSAYVDPAGAGAAQDIDYLSDIAGYLGLSPSAAWTAFQAMPAQQRDLLVDRAFLDFLTQVATDYRDPQSPYFDRYARAYNAIATLFPASEGYTDNNTGGSNGASVTVQTGNLWMARSRIETQTGGDIDILGPGGGVTVGANQTDKISPSQEGILTLQGGSISTYTDGSVQLYQSRIFTEQGGDIDMFSANGDLNAGKGPKSSAAYPPLQLICDTDGYCRVSPAGLVTGAGIGALLTLPGQDPSQSNATLTAPHGTVDAGAAGIRVAGNFNIIALQVLNAFNINVGGKSQGLPTVAEVNVGALTAAGSAASSAVQMAEQISRQGQNSQPSIITVTVLGFGSETLASDSAGAPATASAVTPESEYDAHSPLKVLGLGKLGASQLNQLTATERKNLL